MSKKGLKHKGLSDEQLGGLQHDLNNKLASIKAFNELIQRRAKNKDIKDYSKKIDDQTEEMLTLLEDLFEKLRKD